MPLYGQEYEIITSTLKELQDIALDDDNELDIKTRYDILRKSIFIWRKIKEILDA